MTDAKEKKTFNLTVPQILAGALAAVTAAVLGSQIGIAGTLGGAALGSIVSTVAAAVYQHSLERSSERVRMVARRRPGRLVPQDVTPMAAASGELPAVGPATPPQPTPPEPTQPQPTRPHSHKRRFALAAGALIAFGLSMVAVTGVEAIRGEPLSGNGGSGTTVQRVFGGAAAPQDPQQPATPSPTSVTPSARSSATTTTTPATPTTTPSTPPAATTTPPTASLAPTITFAPPSPSP